MTQLPPPTPASASAATYCTTEAATANEMSMPPAISTTSSPTAKIRLTELVLSRLKRLASVKNLSLASDSPTHIDDQNDDQPGLGRVGAQQPWHTHVRHRPPPRAPRVTSARGSYSLDDPAGRHMQDAVSVEIDFRHLVGDQQDRQTLLGELSRRSRISRRERRRRHPTVGESRMISFRLDAPATWRCAMRCWLPPERVEIASVRPADLDRQLVDPVADQRVLLAGSRSCRDRRSCRAPAAPCCRRSTAAGSGPATADPRKHSRCRRGWRRGWSEGRAPCRRA